MSSIAFDSNIIMFYIILSIFSETVKIGAVLFKFKYAQYMISNKAIWSKDIYGFKFDHSITEYLKTK